MAKIVRANAKQWGRALVAPQSIDREKREVDVVFATETPVPRYGWEIGEDYDEVLVCEAGAVRMDRVNHNLPVMDCHNTDSVFKQIGTTAKVWIDEERRQMCARIRISKRFQDLFDDIAEGIVKSISVGYLVYQFEREEREGQNPIYRAIDWMPTELSFAPVQADIQSEVRKGEADCRPVEIITVRTIKESTMSKKRKRTEAAKTADYTVEGAAVAKGDKITLEDGTVGIALDDGEVGDTIKISLIEKEDGKDTTSISDEVEKAIEKAVEKALADRVADDDDNDDDKSKEDTERSLRRRMQSIYTSTRAAHLPDTYAIELFESGKSIEDCRHAVIQKLADGDAKRTVGGAHSVDMGPTGTEKKRAAMTDVLLSRIYPSAFKLEENSREYRGYTLVELGKELLEERGIRARGLSKDEVFTRVHSTGDFPLLLEDVMNKMLVGDYEFAPEFWEKVSRETSNEDFRAKNFYEVDSKNGMTETPEGAELKYTTLTEGKQSLRLKSYSEGIIFTRQAFINDDLSAFGIVPSRFVLDWNELRGDLVWGHFITNPEMADGEKLFSDAHKNLLKGAESALSESALAAAKVMLSRQRSKAGRKLRILPKYLIVPAELEVAAKKLLTQITPTKTDDVNVFAREFEIIVEPRLEKPTEWFLSADPKAYDTIYHSYLSGNPGLRVKRTEDFDTDSIKFGVRGDFGTQVINHRGLVKSNGK